MLVKDLTEKIKCLTSGLHAYAETNVSDVNVEGGQYLVFENNDVAALKIAVEELTKENNNLEKELEKVENDCKNLEIELDKAQNLLADIKDGTQSLVEYKENAEQATKMANNWKAAHDEMERELTALRKRKGVSVNFFANQRAIMGLLYSAKNGLDIKARAASLWDEINKK